MKRYLLVRLIFFGGILTLQHSLLSQKVQQVDTTWKKIDLNSFQFKYPLDWKFNKDSLPGNVIFSVTPDFLNHLKSTRSFEIMRIDKSGHTFSEFKSEFVNGLHQRTHNETKILYKKDSIFNGLTAVFVKALFFYKTDQLPAKVYAINGKKYFYLITLLGYKSDKSDYIDETNDLILASTIIRQ